jgi:hypothetical protein
MKGSVHLSKQSNQRYRKDMEKKNVKQTNSNSTGSNNASGQDKLNYREFNSPSDKTK